MFDQGPELYPTSLKELVELVERTPGVRFERMLTTILPDPDDQDDLFDEVVSQPRQRMAIPQWAMSSRRTGGATR